MAVRMVECLVQTGAVETPYVRAGHGAPVILLRGGDTPLDEDDLFQRLAAEFRVIAPTLDSCMHSTSFEAWLRGLIDGLGLERPRVIVDAANEQELGALIACLRH